MPLPDSAIHACLDALGCNGPDRQLGVSLTPITVSPTGLSGISEPTVDWYARVDVPASQWAPASARLAQTTVVMPAPGPDAEDGGIAVAYFLTDGAGVPELPFSVGGDGGVPLTAGTSPIVFTPRLPAPFTA